MDKRKNASAAEGAVKKKRFVSDILSQEQERAKFASTKARGIMEKNPL